jgi:hypothetical protein
MQQQERHRIVTRSFVAHVHGHSGDIDEVRRRCRPSCFQHVHWPVRYAVRDEVNHGCRNEHGKSSKHCLQDRAHGIPREVWGCHES